MKLRRIISIGATLLGFFILASSEKSVGHRTIQRRAPEAQLAQPANPMWDSAASAFSCS